MTSVEKNRYWIPNLDINKKVITQEIQYYLGPESTVRPYTREVGPLITVLNFRTNSSIRAKTASS
jgi:hypothetical protein